MVDKKQLTIKSNVVRRTIKDVNSYLKEQSEQEMKIAKMKEENKDEYDIRKQVLNAFVI